MVTTFDLNLLPLYRIKGQEWPQLPGLLVAAPPKRAAHGREGDSLLVYLTLAGNMPFSSADYTQITTQMAQRFYQTAGSLTAAMRTTAEVLNQFLVERNMRSTGKGQYIIGRLILGVLRGAQFIFAQCGPTHVFHQTGGEVRQIHDEQISGRGLGFDQTTPLYFSQADLHSTDRLVLCAQIPAGWERALSSEQGAASPDALRIKLLAAASDDLNAVLIHVQEGTGNVNVLRPGQPGLESAASIAQTPSAGLRQAQPGGSGHGSPQPPADRVPAPVAAVESPLSQTPPTPAQTPSTIQPETIQPGRFVSPLSQRQTEADPGSGTSTSLRADPAAAQPPQTRQPGQFVSPRDSANIPEITRPPSPRCQSTFRGLGRALQSIRLFSQNVSLWFKKMLPRLLPGLAENESSVTTSSIAFIAIVIPLIVVTIASMVYMRYGQRAQYEENFKMAVTAAVGAIGQNDPATVRHAWETARFYIDRAESYQVTQESQALRNQVQIELDKLDGIFRLEFQPAIYNGLDKSVKISRMVATNTDLYLLDSAHGNVLHAFLTNQGFEIDTAFQCGPGTYGGLPVGELKDLAALPKDNSRSAAVLAMDANSTLLYCAPNTAPQAASLTPPELGWRGIASFALNLNGKDLYVLDPAGNAVWVYGGDTGDFPNPPTFFFGNQVPQNMGAVIDMTTNGDELFLLFQDGHVTACILNGLDVVQKPCADPLPFSDNRPGHQAGSTITDAVFSQISFADTPDRSMYLLESLTQAVYRVSPRPETLDLQGQFRATFDQSKTLFTAPATAMAISPNRYLFLSVGNQVYYATDVP